MQLLFETRPGLRFVEGTIRSVINKPEISPEPVLVGDSPGDSCGAAIYGSVIRDAGVYKMWYYAVPKDSLGLDTSAVGYAESDDGLNWRKPELGLVEVNGSKANNLCELGLHCISVYIDPDAPEERRFRAFGYGAKGRIGGHPQVENDGFHSAYSADGLSWTLEDNCPAGFTFKYDVMTGVYHPGQGRGLITMKRAHPVGQQSRRSVYESAFDKGEWLPARSVMIPDEYDDILARSRGYDIADYYGMGLLPAAQSTVGFLWTFRRHSHMEGSMDVSLVYQHEKEGAWIHQYGRPDFIAHGDVPWAGGDVYTASSPIEMGDEQWLYFTGYNRHHGWYMQHSPGSTEIDPALLEVADSERYSSIGIAKWPKWQLFGLRADAYGMLHVDEHSPKNTSHVLLNYACDADGWIESEIIAEGGIMTHKGSRKMQVIKGKHTGDLLCWEDGTPLVLPADENIRMSFKINRATVYAFDFQDA